MAAYRRVCDSRHLQADAKNWDQLWNPTLGSRVWPIFLNTNSGRSADTVLFFVCFATGYIHSGEIKIFISLRRSSFLGSQHYAARAALGRRRHILMDGLQAPLLLIDIYRPVAYRLPPIDGTDGQTDRHRSVTQTPSTRSGQCQQLVTPVMSHNVLSVM